MDARQRLVERCYVNADDFSRNPSLIDDYPYMHVFLASGGAGNDLAGGALPLLFWCIENLEARGWESVAWKLTAVSNFDRLGVVMRRRTPA